MCTCKDKTVDTIFYFAPTKAEYNALYIGNEIDARTITFVAETGEIWKNGVLYGKMSEADLKNMIQKITKENPYILPIATKYTGGSGDHIGGVMTGKYITLDTGNGVISVNVYELFSDPNAQQLIKNVITKEYIENTFSTKATYDRYGIVKVKRDGGITVNDGIIQIDGNNLPDGLRGKDGKDGATPTIGNDGYWYINGINTGVKAKGEKGEKGDAGTGGGSGQNINYLVDVQPWYLVTNLNEGVTLNTPGWTLSPQSPTSLDRYLWKKYKYTYSNAPDVWKGPFLEGSFGEKGDTGPTGPGGGFNPETDRYIQEVILPKVEFNFNWINDLIDGEVTRVELLVGVIDQEIKDRITDMITDTQWIERHYPEGVLGHTDMNWDDAFLGYLLRVGLWETKLDGTHYQWSDIIQRLNSIEANVNTLVQDPSGALTTLQAALLLFSDESTAKVTLDTFWAKTNEMKEVISWLYSGLRGESASDHTFNDLISAAKGEDGGTAASNLHTGIERMLDGTFVAKGSLITELNGEIASGMLGEAAKGYSLATLFSKVHATEENYAELVGEIKTISDIKDPLNPYIEQSMIAKATMYAVEMKTIYEKDKDGVTRAIDVPVRYSNEQCTTISEVDSENIYFKYIQDEDENHNALWVVTEDNGIEYGGETYEKGLIINFNPGSGVVPKWKINSENSSGFITRNDVNIAYSKMFAKDKADIEAKIELAVQNGVSGIEVHADNVEISAGYNLNLNAERVKVTGDINALHGKLHTQDIITNTLTGGSATFEGNVKAKQFVAGDENGTNITVTDKAVCFNYQDDTRAWFSAYDETGTNITDGMNLYIRDPQDHDRIITIDFFNLTFRAVGGNSTDIALPLYSLRNITNSSPINTTQTLYYSSRTGKYYTTPAGTLLATIGGGYYKQDGGKLVLIKDTSNVYRLVSADVYTPVDVTNGVLTEGSSSGIRVVIYTPSGLKYYTNDNTRTNTIQSENIKLNWMDTSINAMTGYTSTQNEFKDVYVLHLSSDSGNTNTAAGNYTLFDEDSSNHAFVLAA